MPPERRISRWMLAVLLLAAPTLALAQPAPRCAAWAADGVIPWPLDARRPGAYSSAGS